MDCPTHSLLSELDCFMPQWDPFTKYENFIPQTDPKLKISSVSNIVSPIDESFLNLPDNLNELFYSDLNLDSNEPDNLSGFTNSPQPSLISDTSDILPTLYPDDDINTLDFLSLPEIEESEINCTSLYHKDSTFSPEKVEEKEQDPFIMVAPFTFDLPHHNYVKIPQAFGATSIRVQIIKSGGKLGKPLGDSPPAKLQENPEDAQPTEENHSCHTLDSKKNVFRSLNKRKMTETSDSVPSKVKAYELSPLEDPEMERCRRNAVNAKRNREHKKVLLQKLQAEVRDEREKRMELAGENNDLRHERDQLRRELEELRKSKNGSLSDNSDNMKSDAAESNLCTLPKG